MTALTASFRKPFAEQVAAFRLRLGDLTPTVKWDDIQRAQHDRAFMVAGAQKADLLADLATAVDKAVSEGTTLEEFRRDFREIVERRGWHGWTGEGTKGGEAWRTKVIYKTNMATTYAAGRMAQLVAANFKYWVYRHGGSREPREQHLGWDGLILPSDHPFWATHAPPNGWGCSCYIVGARTMAGAKRVGGNEAVTLPKDWAAPNPRTGAPAGIDKGWNYAPGASVAGLVNQLKEKLPQLPAPLGAAMFQFWPAIKEEILAAEFALFLEAALTSQISNRVMIVGALKPSWVDAAKAKGVMPESAEIAISDRDIQHIFRVQKVAPVARAWFADLPKHLMRPKAVILEQRQSGDALLLIFDAPGSLAKLVVKIDYRVKKMGVLNTIGSGRLLSLSDIQSILGRGAVLIEGSL